MRTYADKSTKMTGVKVVTTRGGRVFTVTAPAAASGANDSDVNLEGGVTVAVSDGLTMSMERATYNQGEGIVRAPGPIEFSRDRMKGTATGLAYNEGADVLTLLEKVSVSMAPGPQGDAFRIDSNTAEFNRPLKTIIFTGQMTARRQFETMEADAAVAHLTDDEQNLRRLELRGNLGSEALEVAQVRCASFAETISISTTRRTGRQSSAPRFAATR